MNLNVLSKLAWITAALALVSCGDTTFRASVPAEAANSLTEQQPASKATAKDPKGNSFEGTPTTAPKLDYDATGSAEQTKGKTGTIVTMDQRPGTSDGTGSGAGANTPKPDTKGVAAGDDALSVGKGTPTTAQTTQPQVSTQPPPPPPPPPPPAIRMCTRTVNKTFTDGIGIIINSKNHPNSSEDGQCNTSCHWANQGFSHCATRDCRAPGTKNDSLCTQCVHTKDVQESYQCQ
jgi:hypothetical protein